MIVIIICLKVTYFSFRQLCAEVTPQLKLTWQRKINGGLVVVVAAAAAAAAAAADMFDCQPLFRAV